MERVSPDTSDMNWSDCVSAVPDTKIPSSFLGKRTKIKEGEKKKKKKKEGA